MSFYRKFVNVVTEGKPEKHLFAVRVDWQK